MNWVLESPATMMLAAVLLFGAGLGFGGVTGKGWLLVDNLRKRNGNGNGTDPARKPPSLCRDCLLQELLPCKDHSGLVADVKHLVRGTEEIKGVLNELWGAINELRKEIKNK